MTSAIADALRTINADEYDPDENPGGLDGEGGMAENLPRGFGLIADACDEVAGLLNDINFVAEKAAVATILQQVQALVAQVTVGSTNALAFPAVDRALMTAADVVAVHVYDTRLDTDGGAWRLRCRRTSWWAEALNTSTRGARRDFPLVALIVARSTSLTIYDALDLDLTGTPRMWMVFQADSGTKMAGYNGGTQTVSGVSASDGHVRLAISGSTGGGLVTIRFPRDDAKRWREVGAGLHLGNIANRNAGANWGAEMAAEAIVSRVVNAVHARVLPGAPLDPVSGLPGATSVVPTAGGTSVAHPSGAVYDLTSAGHSSAAWLSDSRIALALTAGGVEVGPVPYADAASSAWRTRLYNSTTAPALLGTTVGVVPIPGGFATRSSSGLTLVAEDVGNPANGMSCPITKDSNPGWLTGAVVGAYLCDGTTGSVTGSGELITNGSFSSDLSGWTAVQPGSATAVWSGGGAAITGDGANAAWVAQPIATVVGQTYLVSVTVSGNACGINTGLAAPTNASGVAILNTGQQLFQFTAAATTTWVGFGRSAVGTSVIDNVSVKLCTPDRSNKGKGLVVNGTLSRAAVATGADMAAWSGFSASNYLEQPYNSDLDTGTNALLVPFWFKSSGNSANERLIERAYYTGGSYSGSGWRVTLTTAGALSFAISDDAFATTDSVTTSGTYDDGAWHLVEPYSTGSKIGLRVDGVSVVTEATITNAASGLTNTSAVLRVGLDVSGSNPATTSSLCLLRISSHTVQPAQSRKMYADEAPLFQAGAKAFLGGTSNNVQSISYDESRGVLAVATDAGTSLFDGLARTAYNPCAAAANANHKAVSMAGGVLAIGTAAQAAMYQDAVTGKEAVLDRMRQPPRGLSDFMAFGAVADATPTDLSPRIFVGEREVVVVEAIAIAREYGATANEAAAYKLVGMFKRDAGGNVTTLGTPSVTVIHETTASMDMVFQIDTVAQTIAFRETGKASTRLSVEVFGSVRRRSEENRYAA